jgi:hypothetical protein
VETHVKVLAVLYIVFGALGTLGALAVMAAFGVAGVASAAAVTSNPDVWVVLPILGITGTALAAFLLILSLPGIVAGIGLLKFRPWARILTIVISALNLVHFPLGTILAVYGLWVMLSEEGTRLFVAHPPAAA